MAVWSTVLTRCSKISRRCSFWWKSGSHHMIHIIFILVKPFSDPLVPCGYCHPRRDDTSERKRFLKSQSHLDLFLCPFDPKSKSAWPALHFQRCIMQCMCMAACTNTANVSPFNYSGFSFWFVTYNLFDFCLIFAIFYIIQYFNFTIAQCSATLNLTVQL